MLSLTSAARRLRILADGDLAENGFESDLSKMTVSFGVRLRAISWAHRSPLARDRVAFFEEFGLLRLLARLALFFGQLGALRSRRG